jgi:hypothetical protein
MKLGWRNDFLDFLNDVRVGLCEGVHGVDFHVGISKVGTLDIDCLVLRTRCVGQIEERSGLLHREINELAGSSDRREVENTLEFLWRPLCPSQNRASIPHAPIELHALKIRLDMR